jgi:hypothetical protein
MNSARGLLLASAAGLVAIGGAQAADLPVKAKPVEYVKVCSLYGAGFFYIPGTDTCIKIGGAIRVQAEFNTGAGGTPVGLGSSTEAPQGVFTRSGTDDVNFRNRIYFSVDTRQQTDYGTLRSFFRFGASQTTPADPVTGAIFWDRAFIQFAGFTIGKTVSFFDGITFYDFNYLNLRTMADTGAVGITAWAYTAQLGNGVSLTFSAEDPNGRSKLVLNGSTTLGGTTIGGPLNAGFNVGSGVTISNGLADQSSTSNGFLYPDVIGNLRVDQAWGSAQLMGAMHDASGGYFGSDQTSGHPNNAYGYAVGAAIAFNLPSFGALANVNSQPNVDQFKVQGVWGRGASGFVSAGTNTSTLYGNGQSVAVGWLVDGFYAAQNGSHVELTTAWGGLGGYQHIWTPNWRTSLYAGYLDVSYDSNAQAIAAQAMSVASGFCAPGKGATACSGGAFNPGYTEIEVGTRTQWNPVSQLDVGVEVLYSRLSSAEDGSLINLPTIGGRPAGLYTVSDQDVFSVMFRVQRNFWP